MGYSALKFDLRDAGLGTVPELKGVGMFLNVLASVQVKVEDFSNYIGKLSTPRELVRFISIYNSLCSEICSIPGHQGTSVCV